jgi:RecB family exonuclease
MSLFRLSPPLTALPSPAILAALMAITLLTGPANAGKTARVLDLLAKSDPGRTGTVIVPERGTATELHRRFSARVKRPFHAIRGDAVQDWATFVKSLARPVLPVAGHQHTTLIIMRLLGALKLPHFGKVPRSYATAVGFARTILALKSNLVKPADLAEIVAGLGEARPRERDLIKVYEAYEKELSRLKLLDEGDLTLLALGNALQGIGAMAQMEFIAFDEFTMPRPAELAMVRALGKGLPRAEICITCPAASGDDDKAFAPWLARARDTWSGICDDEELFSPREMKRPEVEVLKASSPAQEARHIALMIANDGLPLEDLIVAAKPGDSFLEWYLSEAHSMELLPEHPTLDGARASPLAHALLSPEMMDELPSKATISRFAAQTLERANVTSKAQGWIRGLKQRRGHGRVAARSLTATAIVKETLEGLAATTRLLGDDTLTREQFAQLISDELRLRTASATMLESVLPFRPLRLGSLLASDCQRLIVPRMTEGSFPSRAGETLFFGDWHEETIRRIFPDAEDAHARECYAFETMMAKCRGHATLVMPAVTDAGSETIPSPFADRFLSEDEEPRTLAACILNRTMNGRSIASLDLAFDVETARIAGEAPAKSPFSAYMGLLKHADARDLVRKRFTETELSATALELYANCPFSFFALHALRTREPPEDTPQIHGFDRGKIVHEVLARYYQIPGLGTRDSGLGGRKSRDEIVRHIVQEVWNASASDLAYVSPGLKEREIEEIAMMAIAVIETEADEAAHISSPLTPSAFEWEFGRESNNALEIVVEGDKPLVVRGRVDRIDTDASGRQFLVIDYKTGKKKEKQVSNQIESGAHLQLPLYMAAVKRYLMPDAQILGGLLIEIREMEPAVDGKKTPGKTKGLVLKDFDGNAYRLGRSHAKVDRERMEALIDIAKQKAAAFAQSIRAGIFPATDQSQCDYCDYGSLCRHKKSVSAD